MKDATLSVVLATFNEESNLQDCLESVQAIAQEIIIVDGTSTDKTVEIAKSFGAHVIVTDNPKIFHINKQKALERATNDWILQLDADERVSPELSHEIQMIITLSDDDLTKYQEKLPRRKLFLRHQELLVNRDGKIGSGDGAYNAFFIPRLNYFLGRYLKYGGVYPDGVIRLVRKGTAQFPCIDVHEQIAVKGRVGWLQHDLLHRDSPTFTRYLTRNKRYITLLSGELKNDQVSKDIFQMLRYFILLPLTWFGMTYFRHKGFLDSWQGLVFSFFSALRFPRAYWQYLQMKK